MATQDKSVNKAEVNKAYKIKNSGEFIMLFPKGNAFLYPSGEAVITESVSAEDIKKWEQLGCVVTEISMDEANELLATSGILGVK